MARILVADDECGIREFIADAIGVNGHDVSVAADGAEAARLLDRYQVDVLITDLKMPGMDGMDLLRKVRAEQPEVEVIILTAHGTVDTAVTAMKIGAFDYLQKPISGPDELSVLVDRALEHRCLLDIKARSLVKDDHFPPLTYGDPAMASVMDAIAKVARTTATVLLLGESGTGKEVAAKWIHRHSDRRDQPFMAVNCAALSPPLLESELFGHEKGAFTGASERRRGRIELADNGIFFLDEVAEFQPELQAKLLRVLQERTFERVGGSRTYNVNVQWIAATNRDLPTLISDGRFREDLYHRLSVFPIRLPPLRERATDIVPLAGALLHRICRDINCDTLSLTDAATQKLVQWRWPGNIRELANVLERAAILSERKTIDAEAIQIQDDFTPRRIDVALADIERNAIRDALERVDGNRRRAAELLDIPERTLYDKLKKFGLT